MSELREVIARALADSIHKDGDYGMRGSDAYEARRKEFNERADDIIRALSEAGRTYEQGVAEVEKLQDPNAVHINMLRGSIAKPSWEQIKHLYPEATALSAQLAQAREGLKAAKALCDNINEFGQVTDSELYDGVDTVVRTTLAALTAGSTEGKDG